MKDVNIYIHTEYEGTFANGNGKWHAILECMVKQGKKEVPVTVKELGIEENITRNHLDLIALQAALKHLTKRSRIYVHTASQFIADAYELGWIDKWIKNDFKTRGKDIKYAEIWKDICKKMEQHDVTIFRCKKTTYTQAQAIELRRINNG